jgi:NDP-sugar pyrophosphorylase family protein
VTTTQSRLAMVVLAGGENARLEALRGTIYKGFLPVHGISLVARHVLRAAAFGIEAVDVVVDEYDPALSRLASPGCGSRSGCRTPRVRILVHAGSRTEKLLWWHRSEGETPFLVVFGDTLAPVDLHALWRNATSGAADSAVGLAFARLPFGVVEVDGDRVRAFREKPASDFLVNTGYMVLGPAAVAYLGRCGTLAEALRVLAGEGLLSYQTCAGPVVVVDSIESLAVAHRVLTDAPGFPGDA